MILVNFNNQKYVYCQESIEILNNNRSCNDMEYYTMDKKWQQLLREEFMSEEKKQNNNKKNKNKNRMSFKAALPISLE